jgi:hypothetical protein
LENVSRKASWTIVILGNFFRIEISPENTNSRMRKKSWETPDAREKLN